jgi:chromosome segregation ATPase
MTSAEHLNKVKSKLTAMKEKIDQTEDRELEAKEKLREAEARLELALGEVDSFKRRLQLVEIDSKRTKESLGIRTNELEGMLQRTKDEEAACKELEATDMESDDKMTEMEDALEEAITRDKDDSLKLAENELKYKVTIHEKEKAVQRAVQLEERCELLEKNLTDTSTSMLSLEEKDADACEREIEGEEKVEFIQEQLKAMVYRYEEAERKGPPLENYIFQIMEDCDNIKAKKKEYEDEMKAMGDMVEDITAMEKRGAAVSAGDVSAGDDEE